MTALATNRWPWLLLVLALVAVWAIVYNSPKRKIGRLVSRLATMVEKPTDESLLGAARKASNLKEILADSILLSAEPFRLASVSFSREDFVSQAFAARAEATGIGLAITDPVIRLDEPSADFPQILGLPEGARVASASFEATLDVDSPHWSVANEQFRVRLRFVRVDGKWLLGELAFAPLDPNTPAL